MAHSWTRLAGALIVAVMYMLGILLIDLVTGDDVQPFGQIGVLVGIMVMAYIWPASLPGLLDDQGRLSRRHVVRSALAMMTGFVVAAAGILFAREYGFLALGVLVLVLVLAKFTIYPQLLRLVRDG